MTVQIAQDLIEECGPSLTSDKWYRLDPQRHHEPAHAAPISIRLRAQLTDFLYEYALNAADSNTSASKDLNQVESLLQQVIEWYTRRLYPLVQPPLSPIPNQSPFLDGCQRNYSEILLAMLDCISCFFLLALDEVVNSECHTPSRPPFANRSSVARLATTAFFTVKERSHVSAAMLQFGLQKLGYVPVHLLHE